MRRGENRRARERGHEARRQRGGGDWGQWITVIEK
jgi:hypothetical protein